MKLSDDDKLPTTLTKKGTIDMDVPNINFIDPDLYNHLREDRAGNPDMIIGHRGETHQIHIHDHPNGQTISVYDRGRPIARTTIPSPGMIDFGKR